jgi:hypothetical protein
MRTAALAFPILLTLLGGGVCPAQDAQGVLDRMVSPEFLTLRGQITLEQSLLAAPQASAEAENALLIDVVLARPNRFHLETTAPTPRGDGLCVSDGSRALYVSHMLGQAVETDAPATLAGVGLMNLTMTGAGASVIVPTLLRLQPRSIAAIAAPGAGSARLLETREICGAPCDVVELTSDSGGAMMTLQFAVDDHGILRLFEMRMESQAPGQSVHLAERFTSLEVDGLVSQSDFSMTPPPDLPVVPQFAP